MKKIINSVFPKTVDSDYKGSKITLYVFTILAVVSMIRSIIHFLAPDGGAGSIAGLDLSKGAENIIFSFGLWGLSQFLFALIQLLVAFRYKTLIPLMYLMLIIEIVGRISIGIIKSPILLNGTPPGGVANYILLPVISVMFVLSLKAKRR